MNYVITAFWGISFALLWILTGPISIILPAIFFSQDEKSSPGLFTERVAIYCGIATIALGSVTFIVFRDNALFEIFLLEVSSLRILDTTASRGLILDEAKSRYPITMEISSGILFLGLIMWFGPKPGSFVGRFRTNLRLAFPVDGAHRNKVLAFAAITAISAIILFYSETIRPSRQILVSVFHPAFSIVSIFSGLAFILYFKDRN